MNDKLGPGAIEPTPEDVHRGISPALASTLDLPQREERAEVRALVRTFATPATWSPQAVRDLESILVEVPLTVSVYEPGAAFLLVLMVRPNFQSLRETRD